MYRFILLLPCTIGGCLRFLTSTIIIGTHTSFIRILIEGILVDTKYFEAFVYGVSFPRLVKAVPKRAPMGSFSLFGYCSGIE